MQRQRDENKKQASGAPTTHPVQSRRTPAPHPRETLAEREPGIRTGRPKQRGQDLQLKREPLPPGAHTARGDEEIVRVRTGVDRIMLSLILVLLALGSIMVFSASYPSALAEEGDSLHYIKRQIIFLGIGAAVMLAASLLPPGFYKKMAFPTFCVATVLLVLVLIPGVGISNGVARRWLGIRGTSFTFQPSEVMKIALILMLARYLDKRREDVLDRTERSRYLVRGTLIPCGILGFACVLVLLEKHLSGTVILGLIGVALLFISGVHPGWMFAVGATGGAAALGGFLAMNPYALERILTFTDENADKLDEAWQTTQGLFAIGSGGPFGLGLGGSLQKYSYVSEAQNDFIFTIWCEEMGFVGAVLVIGLFLLFIWRGFVIAMRAPDTFCALLVFGITCQVGIQAFLNIGVVTDVIPNTGISLPFFSYGGTSLIILMGEMGILLSVSKHSYQRRA